MTKSTRPKGMDYGAPFGYTLSDDSPPAPTGAWITARPLGIISGAL
ncbi:MAG: hypothetical protein HFG83_13170 [Dorea sp.]|nr:hypothetical protein [Dorea sp.]MCI9454755.1 hypothetical protein [Dorea sp.]